MTTLWKVPGVFALIVLLLAIGATPAGAVPYCRDPTVPEGSQTNCNPCELSDRILANTLLDAVDEEIQAFITLLAGDVADLDGNFLIDDSGDSLIASLEGDDIRDVSNQFRILYTIMRNPGRFGPGSVIPAADLLAAYQANFDVLRNEKFGDTIASTLEILIRHIFPFLTYLTLLGKDSDIANIVSDDPIVTNGQGALGVLTALVVLLDGTEITDTLTLNFNEAFIEPGDFIHFGDLLAPDGDLDGDGFTNDCEWRHFKRNLCATTFPNPAPNVNNTIDYVTAVLDPTITPVGCYVIETAEDDCRVSLSGANVVPPNSTDASGAIRYRRFENTETGDVRFQANFFHTLESAAPSARFVRGRAGQAGIEIIRNIPDARPTFWEVYLTPEEGAVLKANSNFFTVTGLSADTVPVTFTIRGDNNCPGFAPPPPVPHAADLNGDFIIDVPEITVIIEYINTGGLRCDGAGGFLSGFGDQNCDPHDSDYNPQDWKINLPELLRLVQLFTAGSYEECVGGSEDGYCITVN